MYTKDKIVLLILMSLFLTLAVFLSGCGQPFYTEHRETLNCSVEKTDDVTIIECPDGTVAEIDDGENGSDGINGVDGLDGLNGIDGVDGMDGTTFTLVDPCGDGPGHDELLIKLNDNTYLAWYYNLGFVILNEYTNYVTTDSQRCSFHIEEGVLL